eukprot:jgi/Chlat1/1224/Chrsp115S01660
MKVIITGAAGFLGSRLAGEVAKIGSLIGRSGSLEKVHELVLVDAVPVANPPNGAKVIVGDIMEVLTDLIDNTVDSMFHLAAVVSSGAEADYSLGMRVNVISLIAVLERLETLRLSSSTQDGEYVPPKLVFASSVAVFGIFQTPVTDDTPALPLYHLSAIAHAAGLMTVGYMRTWQSSYGTEKAIGELLINDATRRGAVDGRCLRLPTIVVRPGKPNMAASSFASSIIREPLSGLPANCPVPLNTRLWLLSPRAAISALLHGHDLSAAELGPILQSTRTISLPGISIDVEEMIAALEQAGGNASLITHRPDAAASKIVTSWPGSIDTQRACSLGFKADASFDALIQAFVDDYMPKQQ